MYLKAECPNYRWTHDNEAPSMYQLVEAIKALRQPQPQTQVGLPPSPPAQGIQHLCLKFCSALHSVQPVMHSMRHCTGCHDQAAPTPSSGLHTPKTPKAVLKASCSAQHSVKPGKHGILCGSALKGHRAEADSGCCCCCRPPTQEHCCRLSVRCPCCLDLGVGTCPMRCST